MIACARVGLLGCLALSFSATSQAEPARSSSYPQPPYYLPYAPPGYYPSGYPVRVQPVAPRPASLPLQTQPTQGAPTIPVVTEPEADPYPRIAAATLDAVAGVLGIESSRLGPVLADPQGRTLYVRAGEGGDSAAPGTGLQGLWRALPPPVGAAPEAPFGLLEETDGSRHWTLDGRPLYRWLGDEGAGDVTGDGVDGAWFAVRLERG